MSYIVSVIAPTSADPIRSNVSRVGRGKTYTALLASEKSTAEDAFRVRYKSYLDSGFISPNPEKIFRDKFDDLPNATTIVVYDDAIPVASVRVCYLSRTVRDAPAYHAFPDDVDNIIASRSRWDDGFSVVEVNRLVRSPCCANNQGLVFLLYRLAGYLGLRHDIQSILSSVRGHHVPFYRRIGFENVAGPAPYPGLNCPMHLLNCSRREYDRVRAGVPLMDPQATRRGVFDGFLAGQPITIPLTPEER